MLLRQVFGKIGKGIFQRNLEHLKALTKQFWEEGQMVLDAWEGRTTGDSKAYL